MLSYWRLRSGLASLFASVSFFSRSGQTVEKSEISYLDSCPSGVKWPLASRRCILSHIEVVDFFWVTEASNCDGNANCADYGVQSVMPGCW